MFDGCVRGGTDPGDHRFWSKGYWPARVWKGFRSGGGTLSSPGTEEPPRLRIVGVRGYADYTKICAKQ